MDQSKRIVDPVSRLEGVWRWGYTTGMGLLAVVVAGLLAVESVGWVHVVNVTALAIFMLDYIVRVALSRD